MRPDNIASDGSPDASPTRGAVLAVQPALFPDGEAGPAALAELVTDVPGVDVESAPEAVVCVNHTCPEHDHLVTLSGVRAGDVTVCPDHARELIVDELESE